jgi:hypothetical protein
MSPLMAVMNQGLVFTTTGVAILVAPLLLG